MVLKYSLGNKKKKKNMGSKPSRIILVGPDRVGKSSLVNRWEKNAFFENLGRTSQPKTHKMKGVRDGREVNFELLVCLLHLLFNDASMFYY